MPKALRSSSGHVGWPLQLILCLLVCQARSETVAETLDEHCTEDGEVTQTHCLAIPRLHFAGRFLADIPTLNNEPDNFNIDNFVFHKDPGFNEMGSGDFRLVNCSVTRVCLTDGSCVDDDPIVGQPIIRSAGKLVDQDPDNQFQPVLWGLAIGVNGFFKGDLVPRPVQHFHDACEGDLCRDPDYEGDGDSATLVSTLQNVVWMENDSTFMSQVGSLRCKSHFKFHVKMTIYNVKLEPESDDFCYGRVVGTIFATVSESPLPFGPYKRMLWGDGRPPLHHAPFYIDKCRKTIVLDFSNSMRSDIYGKLVKPAGGRMYLHQFNGTYTRCSDWERDRKFTKRIKFGGEEWRRNTSGVIEVTLDDDEFKTVDDLPFAVVMRKGDIRNQLICITLIAESQDGLFVSPVDTFAFRKEPHSSWFMKLGVFRFGKSAAGTVLKPRLYRPKNDCNTVTVRECTADSNGICDLEFKSDDPGRPRKHNQQDGQLYFFSIHAQKSREVEAVDEVRDLTVCVHVYSTYSYTPGRVTWYNDVYPIFQQYANLYPAMKPVINLASYEEVTTNLRLLEYALTLPETHPNHMPVSQDLSQAKREMILSWLRDTGGGKRLPPLGTAPHGLRDLRKALQTALELELATIPPYLTAIFSIKDGHNHEVATIIKNVVLDEMKHLTLVANLLNAIGGEPVLNRSSVVLSYPSPLPGGATPGLTVELARCSKNQIRSVFQAIERPDCEKEFSNIYRSIRKLSQRTLQSDDSAENPEANEILDNCKKLSKRPQTIGAMYIHEILCPLSILTIKTFGGIFKKGDPKKQISQEHWLSDSDYPPFKVHDFRSAIQAVATIVLEGEGSDPCNPLDESGEPSHYFKFAEILYGKRLVRMNDPQALLGKCSDRFFPCDDDMKCDKSPGFVFAGRPVPFFQDDVWPIISNPRSDRYRPGSRARKFSDRFNKIFTDILKCLHVAFNGDPAKVKECTGMMPSMTVWAKKLVRTPLDPEGHPNDGPNAAPSFDFYED